jgi:hypothetical protein
MTLSILIEDLREALGPTLVKKAKQGLKQTQQYVRKNINPVARKASRGYLKSRYMPGKGLSTHGSMIRGTKPRTSGGHMGLAPKSMGTHPSQKRMGSFVNKIQQRNKPQKFKSGLKGTHPRTGGLPKQGVRKPAQKLRRKEPKPAKRPSSPKKPVGASMASHSKSKVP